MHHCEAKETYTTMEEAWLAELEMEMNNPCHKYYHSKTLSEEYFDEQLATLGEYFPYSLCPSEENKRSRTTQWDIQYDTIDSAYENTTCVEAPNLVHEMNQQSQNTSSMKKEAKKQAISGVTRSRRQPNQVQDHIIAERKRRELLGQLFISLSAIVPGLKKTDKTSILGEAIKYMKHLKEKVKVLEEGAAKRTMESMVVVKKSQLVVDNESGDENGSSCSLDNNCSKSRKGQNNIGGKSDGVDYTNEFLPEITVKILEKTLLIRVYCENGKGILAKLFAEIDNHDMSISSCSVTPFDSLALDITVVAQMNKGFDTNIKDFIRNLCTSLR